MSWASQASRLLLGSPDELFQRVDRPVASGEDFRLGAGEPHAAKAANRRNVQDLDVCALLGFITA